MKSNLQDRGAAQQAPQGRMMMDPGNTSPPLSRNGDTGKAEIDFAPSPEEVARAAYFTYVNEGCPEGRHVQHWLDAEAQLNKDRERTRTHGFHNRT